MTQTSPMSIRYESPEQHDDFSLLAIILDKSARVLLSELIQAAIDENEDAIAPRREKYRQAQRELEAARAKMAALKGA